jgi:hypothetical protein
MFVTFSISLLARRLAGRRPGAPGAQRWLPPRRGTFED